MNLTKIYFALIILITIIILAYLNPHPIIWMFLIILFIVLLPTILCHLDMIYNGYAYVTNKVGCYKELKNSAMKFLDRYFNIKIIGQDTYTEPVIFVINHSLNDIISDICLMKIKTKTKIIKVSRRGIVEKLFRNIEHIYIDPKGKSRTELLIKNVKEAKENGYSVIIFPEGQDCVKKSTWRQLMPFKNGAFVLANELDMPIVPVIITAGIYNNGIITSGNIEIHYLNILHSKLYNNDIQLMKDDCYKIMNKKISCIDV